MKIFKQKYSLRLLVRFIYYLGLGDYWFETESRNYSKIYKIYSRTAASFVFIIYLDQWLSLFRELSDQEKNDVLVFNVGQTVIITKTLVLLSIRSKSKVVLKRLLEDNKNIPEEYQKASVIKSVKYCMLFFGAVYSTVFSYTVIAIKDKYVHGEELNIEVVLYPSPSSPGLLAVILRPLVAFHWWWLVTIMYATDAFITFALVFTGYRFKCLKLYFKELGIEVEKKMKDGENMEEIGEEYCQDVVTGIKMHEDALWCARNIQNSLGKIYSIQILATIILISINLIRIVSIQRPLINSLPDITYICGLLFMCGTFMTSAGDITIEASELSQSMCYSGVLSLCGRSGRRARTLVAVAMMRAVQPVHMTAFGVVHLTHRNFISVIRASYSFYAVMH